jgi:hypothetical protein
METKPQAMTKLASGALTIERSGAALLLRACGIITVQQCIQALDDLHHQAAEASTFGVLIDARKAVIAFAEGGYHEVVRNAICNPLCMRVAFLVGEGLMPYANVHVSVMGQRGLPRRFFLDPLDAAHWVGWRPRTPLCSPADDPPGSGAA